MYEAVFAEVGRKRILYIPEQLLLVFGLSMDGFAAAVCMGMAAGGSRRKKICPIAALLSGFHVGMVLLGFVIGTGFCRRMGLIYPFAAGGLLLVLGIHMLRTAGEDIALTRGLTAGSMAALSAATSIDALTVGVSFALMGVSPLWAGGMTAVVMGALALLGAAFGSGIGAKHRKRARQTGGLILCILGLRMILGAL